jgi:hypothetical protein
MRLIRGWRKAQLWRTKAASLGSAQLRESPAGAVADQYFPTS